MGSGAAEVQYRIVKILEESVGRKSGLSDPDYARTVVARIRDLEAEVDSLKKERVNYASSVAHAKLGLEAEIERLRDQLEAQCGLTAQIGNAEFLAREKNDVLVSELAKISKWNEKHQAEIERLSEEQDVAHNTISAWVKSGSRMNAVIDELNVAQLEMATLANSRWAEIERLQATLKDQQLWLDAKTDETQNLSSEVKSLRARLASPTLVELGDLEVTQRCWDHESYSYTASLVDNDDGSNYCVDGPRADYPQEAIDALIAKLKEVE